MMVGEITGRGDETSRSDLRRSFSVQGGGKAPQVASTERSRFSGGVCVDVCGQWYSACHMCRHVAERGNGWPCPKQPLDEIDGHSTQGAPPSRCFCNHRIRPQSVRNLFVSQKNPVSQPKVILQSIDLKKKELWWDKIKLLYIGFYDSFLYLYQYYINRVDNPGKEVLILTKSMHILEKFDSTKGIVNFVDIP